MTLKEKLARYSLIQANEALADVSKGKVLKALIDPLLEASTGERGHQTIGAGWSQYRDAVASGVTCMITQCGGLSSSFVKVR